VKALAMAGRVGYDFRVPASAGIGFDSPMVIGAAAPYCEIGAFFAPAILNGGRRWEAVKLAGSYARSVNPTPSATICFDSRVGGLHIA